MRFVRRLSRAALAWIIPAVLVFFSLNAFVTCQDTKAIRIETDLVNVGVTVRDRSGKFVTGLSKDNFEVFDNGKKQDVVLFSDAESPVTYGFVYDLHPTTSDRTKMVLDSIRDFSKLLPEGDDFFDIVFNKRGSLVLGFVPTVEQVNRHLSLGVLTEPNSLYDSILLAAERAQEKPNTKKVLIVITDGKDDDSHHSFTELSRKLKGLNVQIFSILVSGEDQPRFSDLTMGDQPRRLDNDLSLDRAALAELSETSGGRAQQPVAESLVNLVGIYNRIALEMRRQYSLGFYPKNADGKWHKLTVRIDHPIQNRKLKLVYREGYQSPEPQ